MVFRKCDFQTLQCRIARGLLTTMHENEQPQMQGGTQDEIRSVVSRLCWVNAVAFWTRAKVRGCDDATAFIVHFKAPARVNAALLRPSATFPSSSPCPNTLLVMDELICCKSLMCIAGTPLLPLRYFT